MKETASGNIYMGKLSLLSLLSSLSRHGAREVDLLITKTVVNVDLQNLPTNLIVRIIIDTFELPTIMLSFG